MRLGLGLGLGLGPRSTGATYLRMQERNRRFYERYPQDVELVREIVSRLHEAPVELPRGGRGRG